MADVQSFFAEVLGTSYPVCQKFLPEFRLFKSMSG